MADDFIKAIGGTPAQRRTWLRAIISKLRKEAAEKRATADRFDALARALSDANVKSGRLPADVLAELLDECIGVDLIAALLGLPGADANELSDVLDGVRPSPSDDDEFDDDSINVDWSREPATRYECEVRSMYLSVRLAEGSFGWIEMMSIRAQYEVVGGDLESAADEAERLLEQRVAKRHRVALRKAQDDVSRGRGGRR